MLRIARTAGCLAALTLVGLQSALASAFLGPPPALTPGADQWQIPDVGYHIGELNDIGTPKNIGEEYRRNTPVLFYACDVNFLQFFGSNGVAAIDGAFAILNNLTNVSSFSPDLSEFPTKVLERNQAAQNFSLYDLKSWALWAVLENLGLTDPERYVWGIHDRYLLPGTTCPFGEVYLLVKRNFDPTLGNPSSQLLPSSYVNGTLYTYQIVEDCGAHPPEYSAITANFPVDPDVPEYTSIMGAFGDYYFNPTSPYGAFFTDLTRDDVGTMRFLLSSNNIRFESTGTNTTVEVTNTTPQLLFTSNLTLLAQQAFTNNAAALQALFPGLVVASSTNTFVNIFTTNVTITFVNSPYDPAGFPPTHPVYTTNITEAVIPWYHHIFANLDVVVFTNGMWEAVPAPDITLFSNYTVVTVQTQTVSITSPPYDPARLFTIVTSTTSRTAALDQISGQYFILPPTNCAIGALQLQASFAGTFTNVLASGSNTTTLTNIVGTSVPLQVTVNEIEHVTNYAFVYLPINCITNNTALYQGVEQLRFFRADFDTLVGRFFKPITNQYTMYEITNGAIIPQTVVRVLTQPDFLMSAQDLEAGQGALPIDFVFARNVNFDVNNIGAGIAGPGTIDPPPPANVIIFTKVGPTFENLGLIDTNSFLQESSQFPVWSWGSFDGTTNPPVVYPNGLSLADIANEALIQVTPPYLPNAGQGSPYSAQMQTQSQSPNWNAPYTWSLAPGSPGSLPPGLTLSSGGLISGTPTQSGQSNFVIRITDSIGRTFDRSYYITVN